jgi:hypothetical protein
LAILRFVVVVVVVELIGETASATLDADFFFRADPQITHVGTNLSKACVLLD